MSVPDTTARVVLVTGGNRGLGREFCRQLAARGNKVLLGSRDAERGRAAAADIAAAGGKCHAVTLDVADAAQIAEVAAEIDQTYGRLDVLVNNAAILNDLGVDPTATDEAVLRQNLDINFVAPMSPSDAVEQLLWLLDDDATPPNGGFWSLGKQVPW